MRDARGIKSARFVDRPGPRGAAAAPSAAIARCGIDKAALAVFVLANDCVQFEGGFD